MTRQSTWDHRICGSFCIFRRGGKAHALVDCAKHALFACCREETEHRLSNDHLEHIMNGSVSAGALMMDGIDLTGQRDANGRWLPGQSGNARGKVPGTRNRASLMAETLGEGEAEAILHVVVEQALEGDGVAARFCLSRLFAPSRGRAIRLAL